MMICKRCGKEKRGQERWHPIIGLCHSCYNWPYCQRWREENRERVNIIAKERRKRNPQKHRLAVKRCQNKHKERVDKYMKQWRKDNKEYLLKYTANWKKQNPGRVQKSERLGQIRRRTGYDSDEILIAVFDNFIKYSGEHRCEKCGKYCGDFYNVSYHIDHIIPLVKNGKNNHENLQILCGQCNLIKGIDVVDYRNQKQLEVYNA